MEAKSSMDPHTYVSFLDIMVELRTLYKANAIEEALEVSDWFRVLIVASHDFFNAEIGHCQRNFKSSESSLTS